MEYYKRDVADIKRAIGNHRIEGYPVEVPVFGDAFAISSSTSISPQGGITGVLVRPAQPLPFESFAKIMRWGDEQLGLEGWLKYFKERRLTEESGLKMLPSDIQVRLEAGETASMKDVQEIFLMGMGCLDLDRNVACYSFPLDSVSIPVAKLRPGMLVTFQDLLTRITDWMGRVVGFDTDPEDQSRVVLIELFEPIPYLALPKASAPGLIKPGYYSSRTWVIGKGTAKAMVMNGVPLPPGRWDVENPEDFDRRLFYYLDEPLDLSVIEEFCRARYPGEYQPCIRNSMMIFVAPIHPSRKIADLHNGGTFRPLPEDALEGLETEVVGLED